MGTPKCVSLRSLDAPSVVGLLVLGGGSGLLLYRVVCVAACLWGRERVWHVTGHVAASWGHAWGLEQDRRVQLDPVWFRRRWTREK